MWVGLVHITPRPGCDLLKGQTGAFSNAVAVAPDGNAFGIRIGIYFASLGFDVLELDNVERLEDRRKTHHVPDEILDLAASAEESCEVEYDGYFTYD
jgi:hypothetical protein